MDKKISLEYLDDERLRIWDRIIQLEKDVDKKTPEYEKEAKSASKKASEYKNRCSDTYNEVVSYLENIKNVFTQIEEISEKIEHSNIEYLGKGEKINNILEHAEENLEELANKKEKVNGYVSQLENIFEEHDDLERELETLNNAINDSNDLNSKIAILHKSIVTRKREIDEIYHEIIGYTEENKDTGETVEVEGLKQKLEKTYSELSERIGLLKEDLSLLDLATKEKYNTFLTEKNAVYNKSEKDWADRFNIISDKIAGLLPDALTAGLSAAYEKKRSNEEKEQLILFKRFNRGILGLVLISTIPFLVSISFLRQGLGLEEVILRLPRLVLAIFPLYIPVLWLTYSANKKINLSKRLIEEYTHKEVLSKTFEGLSTQIDSIRDEDISTELRLKLLYNILTVNSENPGKLISDYNKSDHPLMDALEKTVKLSDAIDKLSEFPGLSLIIKYLEKKEKKAKESLVQQEKKIKGVLEKDEEEDNS